MNDRSLHQKMPANPTLSSSLPLSMPFFPRAMRSLPRPVR